MNDLDEIELAALRAEVIGQRAYIAKVKAFIKAFDQWDDSDGCTWPINEWEQLAAAREALEDDNNG